MAVPLSAATSVFGLASAVLQTVKALRNTIRSFLVQSKHVRVLLNELEGLVTLLQSLESNPHTLSVVDVDLLEVPLERCKDACEEFTQALRNDRGPRDGASGSSFTGWVDIRWSEGDINRFKDVLAGYKSTITIAIASANLQTTQVNPKILQEYGKMIEDAKANLHEQLHSIGDKLDNMLRNASQRVPHHDSTVDKSDDKAERDWTLRDLQSYERVAGLEDESRRRLPTHDTPLNDKFSSFDTERSHSQQTTDTTLRTSVSDINSRNSQLSTRLEYLNTRLNDIYAADDTKSKERDRLAQDVEISRQCIYICEQATKDLDSRVSVFENNIIGGDSNAVIVTTFEDLGIVHRLNSDARYMTIGTTTDESVSQLASVRTVWPEDLSESPSQLRTIGGTCVSPGRVLGKSRTEAVTQSSTPADDTPKRLKLGDQEHNGEASDISSDAIPGIESGILHDDLDDALTEVCSVFSDVSNATSTTSASGLAFVTEQQIQQLIKSVFGTRELSSIIATALSDTKMGRQRLQRNIRRLIADFAKSMELEATTKDELGVATLLRTRQFSARIAYGILEHYELQDEANVRSTSENAPLEPQTEDFTALHPTAVDEPDLSDISDDSDEQEEGMDTPDFTAIRRFLLDCEAYGTFKLKLLEFVHGSYETRIWRALGPDIILDTGEHLSGPGLIAISRELSWVPTHMLSFSNVEVLSIFNLLKGRIEDVMGEKWNWWPLSGRKHSLQQDFVRIKWLTPCKEQQYIDIPSKSAQLLKQATSAAPAFVNDAITIDMTSHSTRPAQATKPSTSGTDGTHTMSLTTNTSRNLNNNSAIPATSSSTQLGPQASTFRPFHSPCQAQRSYTPRHVFLCVRRGLFRNEHKVMELKTNSLNSDEEMYEWIKQTYTQARGRLAQWCSPWRYDRCDFYKFHKRYGIEPSVVDFPPDDENSYDFVPRPLEDNWRPPYGPIPAIDFRHNYYGCPHQCHSWHKHRYCKMPSQTRHDIQSLPQRIFCIDFNDGQKEVFWGIYAREKREFTWMLAYGILVNIPGTVFFFMWLFNWGHSSDLQNAAVPITFSTTITILFVGLLYESKEGND